jgi:putative oxidoreductase
MLVRRIARPLLAAPFVYGGISTLRKPQDRVPGARPVAGILFGLGRLPRLTALVLSASVVPTTLAGHRFWEHTDPTERFGQISNFLKNAGLLGGLLLAAVDTEGKPSVGYRARRAAHEVAESTEKSFEKAQKRAAKAQKRAKKLAKKQSKKAKKVKS